MAASTDIKFYVHTNNNAPQLTNNFGCMLNALDAALINGIQVGTVSSLTASGKIVTAIFGTAHNLMQYQVIKIVGANQAEYNVGARILTVPNATTITFELAAVPSVATATGTINCSLPSLGWEKPFSSSNPSGGGKAAYRSKNLLLPSRPFLRVVDELDPAYTVTYAKYAKVGIVEDMTDIDTMLGVQAPYDEVSPSKNWAGTGSGTGAINGWAKWYYARNSSFLTGSTSNNTQAPTSGLRSWVIIGSSDWFYILPTSITDSNHVLYGFGEYHRISNTDVSNYFLSATVNYSAASADFRVATETPLLDTSNIKLILFKNYQQVSSVFAKAIVSIPSGNSLAIFSGVSNYQPSAIALGYIVASDMCVVETSGVIRGVMPAIAFAYQQRPVDHLGFTNIDDERYLAITVAVMSNTTPGQILVKIA